MRPTWQDRGYNADVTSVSFSSDPSVILVVASGDPDGPGALPEGTYFNMGYLNQRGVFGAGWNWLSGWPVEIAENLGLSPTGKEILNSRIVFPEDLEIEDPEERNFYILYNTRDKNKDGVYKIEDIEVRRLEMPKYPEIVSLDSLDYVGSSLEGTLAVGVTSKNRDKKDQVHLYYLPTDEERFTPPDWSGKWMKAQDTQNCQVVLSLDFAESGIIFAATSGKNSSFARSYKNILVPISLMDISGGINLLSPSPGFLVDRTLFLNYGNKDILRVRLDRECQLRYAERILHIPEGFDPARIRIEASSNYRVFICETETEKFWLTENGGLSWQCREREPEITDVIADEETTCIASKDGIIYWYNKDRIGSGWEERISSGIRYLQKIELGPEEKILAIGGSKENISDTISLVDEDRFEVLPPLPVSSRYVEAVYSPWDESIYCGVDKQLYRLVDDEGWQKITKLGRIYKILASSQGLYVFCKSKVYFSPFPLNEDSQWEGLGGEELKGSWLGCQLVQLEGKNNLLFLWNSSKIMVWTHQILEEEPEEEILPEPVEPPPVEPPPVEPPVIEPPPVEPEPIELPAEPEPVAPEPPTPPTPPAPPVEPSPVSSVLPWPIWIVIGLGSAFGIYLLIAYLVTYRVK